MKRAARLLVSAGVILALSACENHPAHTPSPTDPATANIPASNPPTESHPTGDVRPRTVYIPAYSNVLRGPEMAARSLLSILLSVRNVDSAATITLTHVDYFDTSGHRVRRYLNAPRRLRPLETAEFTVPTSDRAGGSGANFLVYWEGPSDAHSLLTETVMLGNVGGGYVAFTSRGVELDRRPDKVDFAPDLAPMDRPQDETP